MAQGNPQPFEIAAEQISVAIAAGLDRRPMLIEEVQDLQTSYDRLGQQLSEKQASLKALQDPVDIEDELAELEARAVTEGDTPLFIFARSLRRPYFENAGQQLEAEAKGRIGQHEAKQAALTTTTDYIHLNNQLLATTEPTPFMRLSGFGRNQFAQRRWGTMVLGWLEPCANLELAQIQLTGESRFAGHSPESFTEIDVIVRGVQVAGKVEHQREDGIDTIDRWAYWPAKDAGVIYLLDGTPPTDVPEAPPEPRSVVPLSIDSSSSFLVGEDCFRFLDTVHGRDGWLVGDDATVLSDGVAAIRETLTNPVTYQEAEDALRLW